VKQTALVRRTPLRSRSPKRRRTWEQCSVRGCTRRPTVGGVCKSHGTLEADRLFSLFVRGRDRRCIAEGAFGVRCNGNLQTMHLISRRYKAVRWNPQNARAGCAAHHTYLTLHPLEHDAWCERILGPAHWRALRDVAMHSPPADLAATLSWLRQEVAA